MGLETYQHDPARAMLAINDDYPGTTREKCKQMYEAADPAGRRELVMYILLARAQGLYWADSTPNPASGREHILQVAEGLRIKLPAGRDQEPEAAKPKPAARKAVRAKRGAK